MVLPFKVFNFFFRFVKIEELYLLKSPLEEFKTFAHLVESNVILSEAYRKRPQRLLAFPNTDKEHDGTWKEKQYRVFMRLQKGKQTSQ